jgi:L-2-hydroxycarboxylate dehydrogenase (NAD+)
LATTTAANGKLEILQRKKQNAPDGWVQDADGQPTNDPNILKQGGALLPLGGDREHGSHKGYALGAVVDLFSALLSGANYAPWVPPFPAYVPMPEQQPGKGLGHFLGAMRVDAFRPVQEYKQHMDNWIRGFRGAAPVDPQQPVIVPGDPERLAEAERVKQGIPLMESVVSDLNELSARLGISKL